LSPYRINHELLQVATVPNTIITHDAGSPRDELSPFWNPIAPLTYIGWGKTSSATGWASRWARKWPTPTSSA
jgi:acetolactate synthase-1/2/3 large subunit